jgi:hypothetical protein
MKAGEDHCGPCGMASVRLVASGLAAALALTGIGGLAATFRRCASASSVRPCTLA